MSNLSFLLWAISLLLLLSACSIKAPRYFNSPAAHAPSFLKERGDGTLSANIAVMPRREKNNIEGLFTNNKTTSSSFGFDIHTAYAFSDLFMMKAGGNYRNENDINTCNDLLNICSESKINYERKSADLGAGLLIPITAHKQVVFNPIAGIGFIKSESKMRNICDTVANNRIFHLNGSFLKYYLSPVFNFEINENHKMSFNPQLSLLKYSALNNNYPKERADVLNLDGLKNNHLLFEPAFFYQIGFGNVRWLKLDLGLTASWHLNNNDNYRYIKTRPIQFSAGFSIYP